MSHTVHRLRGAIAVSIVLALVSALFVAPPAGAEQDDVADAVSATIMEIQGPGHLSPLVGQTVKTTGVVTAVAFSGFYIQDQTGDGIGNTSDGVFVSNRDRIAAVGNLVEVVGVVEENIGGGPETGNLSVTRIVGVPTIVKTRVPMPGSVTIGEFGRIAPPATVISDNELPTNLQTDPAKFNPGVDAIDFYEAMEGMRIRIDSPIAVSATRQFGRFSAEVTVLPSRGNRAVIEPAGAVTGRGGILLQPHPDNTGDQNPERIQIQFDGTIYPGEFPDINVGQQLKSVRGVMGYSFGNYEVNATEELVLDASFAYRETSVLVNGTTRVTVASYNVLNLSADESDDAQRALLGDQIVNSLNSPDVIALQEIQDNNGTTDDGNTDAGETLQGLVDAVAAAGGPAYEFFDIAPSDNAGGGVPGGNIRNAYLYNPARVDLVGYQSLSDEAFDGTRDPLIGVFSFNSEIFTVVNVHFSSRFGSTPIFGGPQPFLQAGEDERGAQAAAVNAFVDAMLVDDGSARVLVIGDMNTMEWTNELADILPGEEPVLTNLLTTNALNMADRDDRYSFIFNGNSQLIDHAFVTDSLNRADTKLDIVHTNVDFARTDNTVTASDHDPLVVKFKIAAPADTVNLQILTISDWHAQLDPLFVFREGVFGGAAELSAYFQRERAANHRTLTLTAGDAYGASTPLASFFDEVPAVRAMRLMGFDADTLGNHNFDEGIAKLQERIDLASATEGEVGEPFQYLSANLENRDAELTGVKDYEIFDLDGVNVAVIGVTNPEAPTLVFPDSFGSIVVTDPVVAANAARAAAAAEGAEVFVLLAHMGVTAVDIDGTPTGPLVDLANGVNGFDVIVGDHTDAQYQAVINGAIVVENQSRGRTYARVKLQYNTAIGEVTNSTATFVEAISANITPDQAIVDLLEPLRDELNVLLGETLGNSTVFIPRSDECGQDAGRTCESLVGNVVTDALRDRYGTDFAITNSGGLRAPLTCPTEDVEGDFCLPGGAEGDITAGQVLTVLPFGNQAVTLTIGGDVLKTHLEIGVSGLPGVSGGFAQVSGLCFSYDINAEAGSRVLSAVRQADDRTCTGEAVDLTAGSTYTLAENDFMASGGDGYPNLIGTADTRELLDQVVSDYVLAQGTISPSIGGRITCVDATPGAGNECPVPAA